MDLSEAPKEALLEELKKRKKEESPKPLLSICTNKLKETLEEYFEYLVETTNEEERSEDPKWKNEIYEVALETICGPGVWNWINKQFK